MQFLFAILPFFVKAYVATACTPPNIMLEVRPAENASTVTFPVPMYSDCTLTESQLLPAGMSNELELDRLFTDI
jgi:hypothetical protein